MLVVLAEGAPSPVCLQCPVAFRLAIEKVVLVLSGLALLWSEREGSVSSSFVTTSLLLAHRTESFTVSA